MSTGLAGRSCAGVVAGFFGLLACNSILGNENGSAEQQAKPQQQQQQPERDAESVCSPRACSVSACGANDDGCGGKVECGLCTRADYECKDSTCACATRVCAGRCGYQPDGCEGEGIDCGACALPRKCGAEGLDYCGNGVECTPRTCTDTQGVVRCGKIADGCGGGLIDCGGCPDGQVCGGGGTANVCGCTPQTCDKLQLVCGTHTERRCGTEIYCGGCAPGETCVEGRRCAAEPCVPDADSTVCSPGTCGMTTDSCGVAVACPACPQGTECVGSSCCSKPCKSAASGVLVCCGSNQQCKSGTCSAIGTAG